MSTVPRRSPGSRPSPPPDRCPRLRRVRRRRDADSRPGSGRGGDRGQTVPLLAVVVVVAAGAMVLLGHLGVAARDRARAQTAADAAALAGAVEGAPAARDVAAANGATVESVVVGPGTAEVRVRLGRATASAAARAEWPSAPPSSATDRISRR